MKQRKNKKAMSLMVEYVLLIVFSVVIGLIVYGVLKTYVPKDKIACPDGTSLLIENYNYNCGNQILTLTMSNNGRFNVTGYFVYISDEYRNSTNAAGNITGVPSAYMNLLAIEGIKLGMGSDPGPSLPSTFKPGDSESETYDFSDGIYSPNRVYSMTIVPMRWQSEKGKMKVVSCSDQKITKDIECS